LQAFRDVVLQETPVRLPSEQAFKLDSMGLVRLSGNTVTPRCKLYRDYFRCCFTSCESVCD
ncbi:MAG TPA: AAA-like domain-containing protein, partial [Cyanophyceae cyanobacterium]